MKKKRILSLLLVLCMALSLFACGKKDDAGAPTGSQNPGNSDAGSPDNVGGTESDAAKMCRAEYTNANVGKGMYPGTSEDGAITVECSTMSVMNTLKMTYATELAIARHTYDALVKLDAQNNITPAAATSWESSDDGMKWTFHLREDMKWVDSKGEVKGDVTADDFVFAWSELLNPDNAAEYASFALIFKNAQAYYDYKSGKEGASEVKLEDVGFHAVDKYTLELELETYLPYLLQYLKFEVLSPVPKDFYQEVGADKYGTSPETMLYSGPFYMTEWVTENKVVIEKNPHWYDAANVQINKINFAKYTDVNAKLNAFQGGEIDLIDVNGEQSGQLAAEGYNVDAFAGGYSFFFYTNTMADGKDARHPDGTLSDMRSVNLRKAISAAIDRTQLINTVFKNNNTSPDCFSLGINSVDGGSFGDVVKAANGGKPLYAPTSDPEAAKQYLDAALKDLGYTDPSQINITLLTSEGTANELFSQVVQEQLRQVLGIEAKIEVTTITEARARRNAVQYDMFSGGWGPDYNDPMTDLELWTTNNSNNHTGYASAEYDALIESTKTETDPAKREQLFVQAEQLLAEDMPIIPTYWRAEEYVVSEKIASGVIRKAFQYYYLTYVTLA